MSKSWLAWLAHYSSTLTIGLALSLVVPQIYSRQALEAESLLGALPGVGILLSASWVWLASLVYFVTASSINHRWFLFGLAVGELGVLAGYWLYPQSNLWYNSMISSLPTMGTTIFVFLFVPRVRNALVDRAKAPGKYVIHSPSLKALIPYLLFLGSYINFLILPNGQIRNRGRTYGTFDSLRHSGGGPMAS